MHDAYAAHIYRTMPDYFRDVVREIIAKVDGGRVCDLGSHAMGSYWAAGYIERVDSYSCYDLSEDALSYFKDYIARLQPGDIQDHHPDLLDFLRQEKLITLGIEDIGRQLVKKLARVRQFDFLNDQPDDRYDVVLAIESLPVVDTIDDLLTGLKTAHGLLKDGGLLMTASGPFENLTEDVAAMQSFRIEGRLNPDTDTMARAMRETGFREVEAMTIPIKGYENYSKLGICRARR